MAKEDAARTDLAVCRAGLVQCFEGGGHFKTDIRRCHGGEASMVAHHGEERAGYDGLHHHPQGARLLDDVAHLEEV
ncbi:hypothetical protein FHS42_002799 [Streptomyces zagrosensis]|uniref:Uncharacterized protein n=1 Tax=Streptomyces zagrosensis TaxID=1042984 RepID=A0A7W9UYA2_9ACTN|nr:hypothetical protein [Streptomyces zagrosensis]MBB5935730.1 hypothetical protein [Streptomyces zagrosensis]